MAAKTRDKKKFNIKNFIGFADRGSRIDLPFLIITLILLAYGLVMLYSASYVVGIYRFKGDSLHYIKDQVFFAGIGLVIMYIASVYDYRLIRRLLPAMVPIMYLLMVVVLAMPEWNGCKRWIYIEGVGSFQPSEIAKFVVIVLFAHMIEHNYSKMKSIEYGIFPFGRILGSIVALMIFQPHLSGMIIICAVGGIMMLIGGSDIKYFMGGAAILIAGVVAALIIYPDLIHYAEPRIINWLHPELDPQGLGFQRYQARLAIGSGGLFGLGLGNGRAKHLFVPEPQNDYIFAIVCEELGFVGGLMVILLFIALFLRGIYIAVNAKDKFGAMLVVGIVTQIALQAFLNVAVATGTIPTTGISLPFFSEGGTSLVMILGEIGVVLSVSRYAHLNDGE